MKNILGVVGSPRRNGNTHVLVSRILDGAKEAGGFIDILFLNDLHIRECDGCHACWTGKQCSKNDDMNSVYPKIIESDVIIFGTPVYWYGPTALMKIFIDRFVYFNCPENRSKVRGKSAVIAIPFEEKDPGTVMPVELFFEKCFEYLQMNLTDRIIVPGVTRRGEILENLVCLEKAYNLGKRIAESGNEDKRFTAPCGLYCLDCIPSKGNFFRLVEGFEKSLDNLQFDKYAKIRSDRNEVFKEYPKFVSVLTEIRKSECVAPCAEGGGNPECKIKECVRLKQYRGCWECEEFKDCELLVRLKRIHP